MFNGNVNKQKICSFHILDSTFRRFKNIFVYTTNIPETRFREQTKYCIKKYSPDYHYGDFQTHVLLCENITSGRFVYIEKPNDSGQNVLELVELYIYGKENDAEEISGL